MVIESGGMRGAIFDLLLAPTNFLLYYFQEIYNILLTNGAGVLVFDRERIRVCLRDREVLYLSKLSVAQIL
jgi:hypothetical protein